MKKSLFKSYNYSFDKNESKLITNFCKQAVNQMMSDDRFAKDISAFNSIIDKVNSGEEEVRLTKNEQTRLVLQLKENTKHIETTMNDSWFIKRWLYKSLYNQYINLIETHFS